MIVSFFDFYFFLKVFCYFGVFFVRAVLFFPLFLIPILILLLPLCFSRISNLPFVVSLFFSAFLSHPVLFYPTVPYHIIPYPIISYHTLQAMHTYNATQRNATQYELRVKSSAYNLSLLIKRLFRPAPCICLEFSS